MKRLLVEIWTLKVTLAGSPKEVKRTVEESSVILENTYIVMNRILLEIMSIKKNTSIQTEVTKRKTNIVYYCIYVESRKIV